MIIIMKIMIIEIIIVLLIMVVKIIIMMIVIIIIMITIITSGPETPGKIKAKVNNDKSRKENVIYRASGMPLSRDAKYKKKIPYLNDEKKHENKIIIRVINEKCKQAH